MKNVQNNLLWGLSGGLLKGCLESKRNFMEIGKKMFAQWAFVWRRRIFYQIKVVLN
jgi:hypothetical protein